MSAPMSAQLAGIVLNKDATDPTYDVSFRVGEAEHHVRLVVVDNAHSVVPSMALVPAMQAFMRPANENKEEQELRELGQLVDGLMTRLVGSGLLLGWQALSTTGLVPGKGQAEPIALPDGGICFEGQHSTIVSSSTTTNLLLTLARERLDNVDSEGVERYLEQNGIPFTSIPK